MTEYYSGYTDNGELLQLLRQNILESGYVAEHPNAPSDGINHVYVYLTDEKSPVPKVDETDDIDDIDEQDKEIEKRLAILKGQDLEEAKVMGLDPDDSSEVSLLIPAEVGDESLSMPHLHARRPDGVYATLPKKSSDLPATRRHIVTRHHPERLFSPTRDELREAIARRSPSPT